MDMLGTLFYSDVQNLASFSNVSSVVRRQSISVSVPDYDRFWKTVGFTFHAKVTFFILYKIYSYD